MDNTTHLYSLLPLFCKSGVVKTHVKQKITEGAE